MSSLRQKEKSGRERPPYFLFLVSLPLEKLPLLVLAHLLAALLDDTTHDEFSLLRDEMRSAPMFRDSAAACQLREPRARWLIKRERARLKLWCARFRARD